MELPSRFIEIARSYTRKISSTSNPDLGKYESEDFFCSAKGECHADQAEDLSERLTRFCRSEVYKSIRDKSEIVEVDPIAEVDQHFSEKTADQVTAKAEALMPSIDKYAVEVVGEANPSAEQKKEVDEPSRLRAIVMGTVPGCTKKHLASFYVGWFGAEDSKHLPKDQGLYIEPLGVLLKVLDSSISKESIELLISNPNKLGSDLRSMSNNKPEDPTGVAVPDPTPGKDGEWSEIMEVDPLMEKFGWHSIETVQYAKALMAKYSHDHKKFSDHIRFLRMDTLSEPELLCLFKLLFHAPDGNMLWRKSQCKMPLLDAFAMVEHNLGHPVTMQSKSHDVLTAITVTMQSLSETRSA